MKNILKQEILSLKNKPHINQKILQKFLERLEEERGLFRFQNLQDHYCVYFLPLDFRSRSIFLGHHIKANAWIPPGGHIEENEHPTETVKREFLEELAHKVSDKQIEFFDLTITDINNPKQKCKRHWDLWYLVHIDRLDLSFDKREFYNAGWFKIKKALPKVEIKDYNTVIRKLLKRMVL